jgi:hypothetical protein
MVRVLCLDKKKRREEIWFCWCGPIQAAGRLRRIIIPQAAYDTPALICGKQFLRF